MKLVDLFSAHNSAQKKLHKMLFTNQALCWRLLSMPIHYYGVQSMSVCVRTNSDAVPFNIHFLPVFSFRGHSLGFICERFESSIFSAQVRRQNCLWGLKLMTSMWYKGHGSTRADMGGLRWEALKYTETCIERTPCIKADTLIQLLRY